MTRSDLTHLYVLLDRSGSMQSIKSDIVGGFDAFVAEQRSATGECRMTLARFDNEYELVFADVPITQVGSLVLEPRGSTALLDSIGRLVVDAGARLAALPEHDRPGTVVVAVMTDGFENASREWTHASIKALVDQQTKDYGWQFLYMGADQDAVEVGTGARHRRGPRDDVEPRLGQGGHGRDVGDGRRPAPRPGGQPGCGDARLHRAGAGRGHRGVRAPAPEAGSPRSIEAKRRTSWGV